MEDPFTIRLSGGLGNQMFQYAFGLATHGKRRLFFDTQSYRGDGQRKVALACFGIELDERRPGAPARILSSIPGMWRLMRAFRGRLPCLGTTVIWDRLTGYCPLAASVGGPVYAIGYWQDEQYFTGIEADLRRIFSLDGPLHPETQALLESAPVSIGVQVRRGDYLVSRVSRVHPPPSRAYFESAVGRLLEKHGSHEVIVCTDDVEWAKANLRFPCDKVSFRCEQVPDHEDMSLLSRCAHIVISNSSFGWWSAWLGAGSGSGDVVCPDHWYGDAVEGYAHPGVESWIRLDC